ncbi:DUF4180 domain-containing protein [Thermomonospora amylolytica]|uniref:DUF4180 domain-containing protein n=1 Tax=Thermomonospora amylolytica TaxID=1411117 RepID=UPI000E6CC4A4|nr:DUF4180 domain-containing protein [Thermomonospora amylolytica]
MPDAVEHVDGVAVLMCAPDGAPIVGEQDALDLIGNAGYQDAGWVVIPVARLHEDFFRLRTGVAGAILQKFANYGMGVAVLGDVSAHVAASDALRDLVREYGRGTGRVRFAADLDDLRAQFARIRAARGSI